MAEEKIQLIYEAPGAQAFTKAAKDSEIALRRQARALDESARALQKEISELKGAAAPNRALIAEKQKLLATRRLESVAVKGTVTALRQEASAAKESVTAVKTLSTAMKGFSVSSGPVVAALAAIIAALTALPKAIGTADAFGLLKAKISNALESAKEFPGVFSEIIAISNRTGIAIDGVSQAFVRLAPAAKELGVTNDQLLKFSETYLKMGQLAGATSEEIQNSMVQLSQGLASGALRGDELRSVMEQMPGVARTIAASMGIPFDKFRKAAEEGKITAQEVFKAILGEAGKTDKAFAALPVTVARSFTVLGNSAGIFIDKLNTLTGATKAVSGLIMRLSELVGDLSDWFDKAGPPIKDVVDSLIRLGGAVFDVIATVLRFNPIFSTMIGLLNSAALALQNLPDFLDYAAYGIDVLATKAEQGAIKLRQFANAAAIVANPFKSPADKNTELNKNDLSAALDFGFSETAFLQRDTDRRKRILDRKLGLGGAPARQNQPLNMNPNKPEDDKKKKASDKTAQIERQRISDLRDALQSALKDVDIAFEQRIAQLGAFASEADKIKLQQQKTVEQQKIIAQYKQTIAALTFKSAEGIKEQRKEEKALGQELKQGQTALIENNNQLAKLREEQARFVAKIEEGAAQISLDANIEAQRAANEELSQQIEEAYKDREITARQYYDTQRDLIQRNAQLEIAAINQRAAAIKAENENLKKSQTTSDQNQILENNNELAKLTKERQAALEKAAIDTRKIAADEQKTARAITDRIGDSFEQSVSEAIQTALNSGDVLGAVKGFAKAFRESIVKELADGLARSIKPVFQPIFNSIGNWISRTTGQSPSQQSGGSLLPKGLTGSSAGSAVNASGASARSRNPLLSFFSAAAAPLAIAGASAANAIKQPGGLLNKYVSFIDPLGLRKIFGFGTNKKANQQAARLQKTQDFVNAQVSSADPNNLLDLDARLGAVLRYKSGSSAGVRAKRAAAQQLQALIAARQKAIDEAKKEIIVQNEEIAFAIAEIGAKPGETYAQGRDLALKRIERDTAKLLEEFKDSEEMKTKILEQQSLKRQQLFKEEQDAARQGVEDLQDLLQQRDDVANRNVFKRLRSTEQVKADDLKSLDRDIAGKMLELQAQLAAGVTPLNTAGLNQILGALQANAGANANLQIVINEANDPNAVREEVTRALNAFYQKAYGVKVA